MNLKQSLTPEEALRRHRDGDHSPEVLAVINQAAWEAFHAPWESNKEEASMSDDRDQIPTEPAWKTDPMIVAPLTIERLEYWAKEVRHCSYYRQSDDDRILVRYRYSPSRDKFPDLTLSVEGKQKNILRMVIRTNSRIEPQDFVKALRLVNSWNQEYRWPNALVRQDYRWDSDEDEVPSDEQIEAFEETHTSEIRLQHQSIFPSGIHQAGLNDLIGEIVATSWDYWKIARDKWGL